MPGYELLLALIVFFFSLNVSNLGEGCGKHPFKDVSVVSGEGESLALEFHVDDGVVLGRESSSIFTNSFVTKPL